MKILVLLFAALLVVGCGEKPSSEGSDSVGESTGPSSDAAKQVPTESPGKGVEEIEVPGEFLEIDWGSGGSSKPGLPSLSDADVERLLKEAVDIEGGVEMVEGGRLIASNGSGPFSGWIKFQEESGKGLQQFKDGKADGPRLRWYKNGQLGEEEAWDNGQLVAVTVWMPNGDKCPNTKFKNGSGIVHTYWDNGQKFTQSSFKDGKESGLSTMWHENGQKQLEQTYRDGQMDGLQTWWHENGQKQIETTWKDDKPGGPQKYWNSKGEEVETLEEAEK